MNVEEMEFEVDGHCVVATLAVPDGASCVPAVLTAPGFAGVKEMLIPAYSAELVENGVASMAFDYPGFGGSAGSPRQHVDPQQQVRAFRQALEALSRHPRVDSRRIGVWGTSLSGGHALVLAAADPRIRAVAAVIPFISLSPLGDLRLASVVARDQVAGLLRRPRLTIPVAGRPGEQAVMNSDGAYEWAQWMASEAPAYRNEVTVASLPNMLRWSTRRQVRALAVPTLCVLAESDTITPPARVLSALAGLPDVQYLTFPQTHFELFTHYGDQTRRAVVTHLSTHL